LASLLLAAVATIFTGPLVCRRAVAFLSLRPLGGIAGPALRGHHATTETIADTSAAGVMAAAAAGYCLFGSAAAGAAAAAISGARTARRQSPSSRRTPTVTCSAGKNPVETFLVPGPVDEQKLTAKCASLAWHLDLSAIVFFNLGVKPEIVASVAGGALGLHGMCPIYVADCYGIVGWDDAVKANVELMEEGRGTEYGGVGGKGGEGVVVVAFRGDGHVASAPDASGGLPSAGLHMLVTGGDVPAPSLAGAIYGGVAKACYRLEHSGDLVSVPQFAISSPSAVLSSFAGEAGEAATKAAAEASTKPEVAGYFPCYMRGINKYGEDGVEPAAFASNGLDSVKLFGMFAHGEFGPAEGAPVACQVEGAASSTVTKGSMISVLALYGD